MQAEEKSQGVNKEMQELCRGVLDQVIPRLLRRLETGAARCSLDLFMAIYGPGIHPGTLTQKCQSFMMQLPCVLIMK